MANLYIEHSPDSFFAPYIVKGWMLYYAGMVDSARTSLERAIELGPERWWAYFEYGRFCLFIADNSGAKKFWELSLKRNPDHQATHRFYGNLISRHFNMLDEGAKHLRRSIELNPNAYYSYDGMANIYSRWGNYDSTMWYINRAIELSPNNEVKLRELRKKAAHQGIFNFVDSATAVLEEALLIKPADRNALWLLAGYCTELKDYDRADSLYQLFTQLPDSMSRALGRKFAVSPLIFQGKIEQAIKRLREAIAVDLEETGYSAEVREKYLQIGHLCRLSANYEAALDAFEEVRRVEDELSSLIARGSGKNLETTGLIACMLVRTGHIDSADAIMENCYSSIDPADTAALSTYGAVLATVLEAKGDYDSAVVLFQQRVGLAEPIFMRLYNLGVAYLRAGRAEEAVETLKEAADRHDANRLFFPWNSVMVYKYLGDAYDLAGHPNDAIKQYEIFLDYWQNADEGLTSVEDARVRLANLKKSS
jgi:tetratricopeptide (TPR) repeat protein